MFFVFQSVFLVMKTDQTLHIHKSLKKIDIFANDNNERELIDKIIFFIMNINGATSMKRPLWDYLLNHREFARHAK